MKRNFSTVLSLIVSAFLLMSCNDPKPGPTNQDDYNVKATHALGEYVFTPFNEGLANFYVVLSEMEVADDFETFEAPGLALSIDLFAKPNESKKVPAGTYEFIGIDDPIFEFAMSAYSNLYTVSESMTVDYFEFETASLTVTHPDANTLHFDFKGVTIDGKTVTGSYTGEVKMIDGSGSTSDMFPPLEQNIQTTFIDYKAYYLGKSSKGEGKFTLRLFDYTNEGFGSEGSALHVELLSTVVDGKLVPAVGKYTVTKADAAGTITPGWIDEEKLQNLGTSCTFTKIYGDDVQVRYGIINAGTLDVALENDVYTLTINLMANNGKTIKGSYVGALKVEDRSYHSTLKADKDVDLGSIPCEVEYFGQSLKEVGIDGNNWMVYMMPTVAGGDGLQLNLVSPVGKYADGLPAGDYPVKTQYATGDKICIPGEYDLGDLYCSWFVGRVSGGMAEDVAPFRTGNVMVDKMGTDYTIMCDIYDDAPKANHITILWEGSITKYFDMTAKSKASASPHNFKTNAQPKVTILENQTLPMAQIKGVSYTNSVLRKTLRGVK